MVELWVGKCYGNLIVEKAPTFSLLSYIVFSLQYSVLLCCLPDRITIVTIYLWLLITWVAAACLISLIFIYTWSYWYGIVDLDKWTPLSDRYCFCDLQNDIPKCIVLGFLEICKGFIRCRTSLEYLARLCILNDLELHSPGQ